MVRSPSARNDFVVSAEASLDHDATELLQTVRSPTLVIGGAQDRLFPASLQRETAERIPDARLQLIEETGHGAFDERKRAFDAYVKEFVSRQG